MQQVKSSLLKESHYDARVQMFLGDIELSVQQRLRVFGAEKFTQRFWAKDTSLWSRDFKTKIEIQKSLGWLTVYEQMKKEVPELKRFAQTIQKDGFTDVLLLGMGGSSLCPEVLRQTFGEKATGLKLHVLDSTDPEQIKQVEKKIHFPKTIVIVASKSGNTVEIEALSSYFRFKVSASHFIAITDPNSPLHQRAQAEGFRNIFLNPSDIGGRFSALSYFGLVPAALLGVDIEKLLQSAWDMASITGPTISETENVGLILGSILGEAHAFGRNKLTLFTSPEMESLSLWVEQLVSESTGKGGKGILPVFETATSLAELGSTFDRIFCFTRLQGGNNEKLDQMLTYVQEARLPYVLFEINKLEDVGGEFLRWEIAAAVAGAILQIQPFDQPNVQETKILTKALLGNPKLPPLPQTTNMSGMFQTFLNAAQAGDYIALLAYLPSTEIHQTLLDQIRCLIQTKHQTVATVGFGPRYLHSTGQLHKGGISKAHFVILTSEKTQTLSIPGKGYNFNHLQMAQAMGDFQALLKNNRHVLHLHLEGNVEEALQKLQASFSEIKSIPVIQ